MRKRPLGKTGLFVSEMGLGTWGLSGDPYGPVTEADATAVIERALDIGFTLFETADAYAGGKTETLLGKILRGKPDVVLVTRGGLDRGTDPPRKRFDKAWLLERVKASAKRIGKDAVPVYLLHNPSPDALVIGEGIDAMVEAKKAGLVEHWGVACGDVDVAKVALDRGAEVVEMAYNLFHARDVHRVAGELMVCRAGLLARSTLAYGLLAGLWSKEHEFAEGDLRRDRWTRLELEKRIEQLDAVRYLVRGDVLTMRAAAVRFVLANHLVTSAVLGPRTVTQLEQLVRETGAGPRYIPDADLAELPRSLDRVGIAT